jgi:hypothetical protein
MAKARGFSKHTYQGRCCAHKAVRALIFPMPMRGPALLGNWVIGKSDFIVIFLSRPGSFAGERYRARRFAFHTRADELGADFDFAEQLRVRWFWSLVMKGF